MASVTTAGRRLAKKKALQVVEDVGVAFLGALDDLADLDPFLAAFLAIAFAEELQARVD